VVRAHRFYW